MPRLTRLAAIAATLLAVGACIWFLLRDAPPATDVVDNLPSLDLARGQKQDNIQIELPQGGVYGGIVVDGAGTPIEGATVMLVAFNAGKGGQAAKEFDPGDPSSIPTVGDFYIGGREAKSGVDGRWRIPADTQARVSHALAYHRRYFLNVAKVGRPSDDVLIQLKAAGRVKGTVVDDATGRPVSNVRVDVFLQHPTAYAPEYTGGPANRRTGRPELKRSEIAMLGHFLAKELGQRIWDIPYQGTEALRFQTDSEGRFDLAPLGEGVQLEFVITHPDYVWFDFDTQGGKQRARRTVVAPGATVEREFRLRKGKRISGHVYDDANRPIKDVTISFESITAYHRHWWDANGKKRFTTTDAKGFFTMGGLAIGSHNLVLTHGSFGKEFRHGATAGTKALDIYVKQRGRIIGTIEGLEKRPPGGRIYVHLEPRGEHPGKQMRLVRKRHVLDRKNRFSLEKVKEGPYDIWIQAGLQASMPQRVDVKSGDPVNVSFVLGGGGSLELRLVDSAGGAVDPAMVHLLMREGGADRALGRYVSREGVMETDNVVPGHYRLRIEAPGFIAVTTDPFDVLEGRPTDAGMITMHRYSYLKLSSVMTDRRTTPKDAKITYREGEGAWKPLMRMTGYPVPVKPGRVTVKAVSGEGFTFEQVYTAPEGETFSVDVVLPTR